MPGAFWGAPQVPGAVLGGTWGTPGALQCTPNHTGDPPHLQGTPLGGVEDEELLQQVLTISRHVEGDPVFAPQHPLPQLLGKECGTHQCWGGLPACPGDPWVLPWGGLSASRVSWGSLGAVLGVTGCFQGVLGVPWCCPGDPWVLPACPGGPWVLPWGALGASRVSWRHLGAALKVPGCFQGVLGVPGCCPGCFQGVLGVPGC